MKLLSRLIIALAICLIAIPVMATPVQAAGISGMTLHPTKGIVGEEVYITGDSDDDDDYWVYYKIDTDEWVEVLDDDDFDFDEDCYNVGTEEYCDYDYETEKFEVPESCSGKHKIAIVDRDLGDEADDDDIEDHKEYWRDFTVEPKVEIIEIAGDEIDDPDDAEGSMGTEVKVKGTGFDEDEEEIEIRFYINSDYEVVKEDITADDYGSWEATFMVPAAGKGEHHVSAEGEDTDEEDVLEAPFEILPGISISATEGYVGDTITVSGSGFEEDEEDIKVTYGGDVVKNTEADEDGCWEVTFAVPESAKGKHEIDAYGEDTKAKDIEDRDFSISPKAKLTPTEGHVDTSLTISGDGFPANKSVTVTYDGETKTTATTSSKGTLPSISFEATHTQSTHKASHPVVVTCDTTTFTLSFTMESAVPPKPTLTSPASGSRLGFIHKVTPTFTWSGVTDPSGVSYNLQIGTNADFAQVLISQTGLSEPSYTLTEAEALDYGTYYWRVKAIDGAQNDSGWAAAYSFKSGLLPLWAFIAIIALIVVLIGFLIYFFVRRRGSFYD